MENLKLTVAALSNPYDWTSTTTTGANRLDSMTVNLQSRGGAVAGSTGWNLTPNVATSVTTGAFATALPGNGTVVLHWTFSYTLDGQPMENYAYSTPCASRTRQGTWMESSTTKTTRPSCRIHR